MSQLSGYPKEPQRPKKVLLLIGVALIVLTLTYNNCGRFAAPGSTHSPSEQLPSELGEDIQRERDSYRPITPGEPEEPNPLPPDSSAPPSPQPPSGEGSGSLVIFIDPNRGQDQASGSSLDDPLRSLQEGLSRARDAFRTGIDQVYINLLDGRYELAEPLTIDNESLGLQMHTNNQLVIQALNRGRAILSGGERVDNEGWQSVSSESPIYKKSLRTDEFRDLYVNGARAQRARSDFLSRQAFEFRTDGYESLNMPLNTWRNPQDLEFVFLTEWTQIRCGVDHIEGQLISFDDECWRFATSPGRRGKRLQAGITPAWIENSFEMLDAPGEWYYDRQEQALYYYLREEEHPSRLNVVIPRTNLLLNVQGSPQAPLRNLFIRGLKLSETTWLGPSQPQGYADVQAGYHYRQGSRDLASNDALQRIPAAVEAKWTYGFNFEYNTVENLGATGLALTEGVKASRVRYNLWHHLGAGAIHVGETSSQAASAYQSTPESVVEDIEISGNEVRLSGVEYLDTVGIFIGYARNVRILQNIIYDLPYTAISLGWGWSDALSTSGGHRVEGNHIHHVMSVMNDGGGIYTLGRMDQSHIRSNYVHHLGELSTTDSPFQVFTQNQSYLHMARTFKNAIYLDNGTMGVSVAQNSLDEAPTFKVYEQCLWPGAHDNQFENTPPAPCADIQMDVNGHLSYANTPAHIRSISWSVTAPVAIERVWARRYVKCDDQGAENREWTAFTQQNQGRVEESMDTRLTGCHVRTCVLTRLSSGTDSSSCVLDQVFPESSPLLLWHPQQENLAQWRFTGFESIESRFIERPETRVAWSVLDAQDFNGDSQKDILLLTADQRVAIWFLDGPYVAQTGVIQSLAQSWNYLGAGDFNRDGQPDLLWRNPQSNEIGLWLMNQGTLEEGKVLQTVHSDWKYQGTGDLNGDEVDDIVWRHSTTQELAVWFMSDGRLSEGHTFALVPSGAKVMKVADFNGDGKADILWQHEESREVSLWLMNGTSYQTQTLQRVESDWKYLGTEDLNSDGRTDVVWRNSSGTLGIWYMNGGAFVGGVSGTINDPSWKGL